MRLRHYTFLILHSALALCAQSAQTALKPLFALDFEKTIPSSVSTYKNINASIDTTRAHSGRASMRFTKKTDALYIGLDDYIDFNATCEFSLWVYLEPDSDITVYISADDGTGGRRNFPAYLVGALEPGRWCRISGIVLANEWRKRDSKFQLSINTSGPCWIDDIQIVSGLPPTPSQIWPALKQTLHAAADKRVTPLSPGATLTLDPRHSALAPDTARLEVLLPTNGATAPTVNLPANGLLVFAIDAKDDLTLTATLHLAPDTNYQPGIRATILSDDTIIAAPSVKAAPWKYRSTEFRRIGPAPKIEGEVPPSTIEIPAWRMPKGRHYITIAGPHMRPAGAFSRLELRASARPVEKPLYTFALITDTHVGLGRPMGSNHKLSNRAAGEMEAAHRQLKQENASFVINAGDMTDQGRKAELTEFAAAVKRAGLPVYACIGNHDTYRDARSDIASILGKLFPSGPKQTDYAFPSPPLRFIVLDGSWWRHDNGAMHGYRQRNEPVVTTYREGMSDWLRDTLAKDTATPTIVVSHYPFYSKGGISDVTGRNFGDPDIDNEIMSILEAAPNVIAALNGHRHYNSVSEHKGIIHILTPSFVEWPNAYRVFRVYPDRLEWEMRQMSNRGLIHEGVIPSNALLWMLSTSEGDLSGTIPLRRKEETKN